MNSKTLALAVLVFAPAVTAQEAGRYLPRDAAFYMHCDSPEALRNAFRDTDLYALLSSRDVEDLIDATGAAFRDMMGSEDVPPQLERLGEVFDRFEGRLRLAVVVEPPAEGPAGGGAADGEPRVFVTLELTGSDVDALEEMAVLFAEISEFKGDETIDVSIAGETFRGMESGTGELMLLPKLMGESLVVYMGHDVEKRVAGILDREQGAVPDRLDDTPLAMRVDVEGILELLAPFIDEELPFDAKTFYEACRFDGLRDVVFTVRPEGARTQLDFSMGVDPQRPSLLEFIRPEKDGRPRLLGLVPRQHRYWSVGHLRPDVLYDWIADLLRTLEAPMDMTAIEGMFEQQFKVRLREDLLAHWGDEVLSLSSTRAADPDAGELDAMLGTLTLAFEMDDAAAFEESFERLLRARGLHVGRKTREYRGVEVRTLRLFGILELHYAFGDDVALLGFGKQPDGLNQLLDRLAARREGEEPGAFPERVAERLQSMPDGWQGVGVTDVRGFLQGFAEGFAGAMYDMPPEAGPVFEEMNRWVDTLAGLVERYDLELMVSTSKFSKDRILSRMIW